MSPYISQVVHFKQSDPLYSACKDYNEHFPKYNLKLNALGESERVFGIPSHNIPHLYDNNYFTNHGFSLHGKLLLLG